MEEGRKERVGITDTFGELGNFDWKKFSIKF